MCEQKRKELEEEIKKRLEKRVIATNDVSDKEDKKKQEKVGEVGYQEGREEGKERGEEVGDTGVGYKMGCRERREDKEPATGKFEELCVKIKQAQSVTEIERVSDGYVKVTADDFMEERQEVTEESEVTGGERAADIESDDSDCEDALKKFIYDLDNVQF